VTELKPFYENVQAHYDLSNEFFALFLDPSMTYSCAYWERGGMTLEEAQLAKIDLALGKLGLEPGMRLLDVGCGWGATIRRAVEKYGVRAVGLTLSRNQCELARERLAGLGGRAEVRLQGWEEFDEPVDRIVSIGAFEHFREERYPAFFAKCHALLPAGGVMLLHSIIRTTMADQDAAGVVPTHEEILFGKWIHRVIFPGGQLRPREFIVRYAEQAGFRVTQVQALAENYAKTLDAWAANLRANREEAVAVTSEEAYQTYMHYLTGCAPFFRRGLLNVAQFTCRK
jgi:cyclopropane-fatty-acyl-phospholipid synthase